MEHSLDRRTFVLGAFAGAGALALGADPTAAQSRRTLARSAAFAQGVASGFPRPRGIALWTRVEDIEPGRRGRNAFVELEVARDRGFRRVVERRLVAAHPDADRTVHAQVGGLDPREEYFYRFSTRRTSSAVGRFRTPAPAGSREPVRIAYFSCQNWVEGFYHAHADLARQDDVDLVVCLGDYIYERSFIGPDDVPPVRRDRTAPDGETETLGDYRRKYNLYHSDPDLRAIRAKFPLVAIWDDHEVEDNYADGRPGGASMPPRRVPYPQRKRNGYRAWFEHMPRGLQGGRSPRTYGSVPLGNAEVFLLDQRQYRGNQPCNPTDRGGASDVCPPSITDDPRRTMLGRAQKRWLKRSLQRSRATWKVVANQVMMMSFDRAPGSTFNTDGWDGYGAERAELVDFIAREGIDDVTFITGDVHVFYAGTVHRTGRQTGGPSRATEFVGGGVTSAGLVDGENRSERARLEAGGALDDLFLDRNPHWVYSNVAYKGYALLEARRNRLDVRYRAVRDARERRTDVFDLRRFEVQAGRPRIIDRGGPRPGA